jgi:hypothetical protein
MGGMEAHHGRLTYAAIQLAQDANAAEGLLRGLAVPRRRLASEVLGAIGEACDGPPVVLDDELALRVELANLAEGQSRGMTTDSFAPGLKELGPVERKHRRIGPLAELLASVPPEPDWLWNGYIAPSSITLLAGRPKVGKSTLAFGLIAAITSCAEFMGRSTRAIGVLLLTEEREGTLAEKQRRLGLDGQVHLWMRHDARGLSWREVVAEATAYCHEHSLGLIVVDTLDKWVGLRGDDENKAGAVLEALQPLFDAAGDGVSILLITHQRKSEGRHGDAVRGSNALAGAVDVIIEVERVPGGLGSSLRKLHGTSRFESTPEELVFELTDEGFLERGDSGQVRRQSEYETIRRALRGTPGSTAEELAEATGISKSTVRDRLDEIGAEIERTGTGKKGDPYRYRLADSFDGGRSLSVETNADTEDPDQGPVDDSIGRGEGVAT